MIGPSIPRQGSICPRMDHGSDVSLPPTVLHKLGGQGHRWTERADDSPPSQSSVLRPQDNLQGNTLWFLHYNVELVKTDANKWDFMCLFKELESLIDSCVFYTVKVEFLCTAVRLGWFKNCPAKSRDYLCTCYLHGSATDNWYNGLAGNNNKKIHT